MNMDYHLNYPNIMIKCWTSWILYVRNVVRFEVTFLHEKLNSFMKYNCDMQCSKNELITLLALNMYNIEKPVVLIEPAVVQWKRNYIYKT